MKRLATLVVVGAAFLGASAVNAKEPPQTAVCGKSLGAPKERACLHLTERDPIRGMIVGSIGEPFHMRSRPRPAPFYTVTVHYRENSRWDWSFLYVPRAV